MTYAGIQSRSDLHFHIIGDSWLKGIYAQDTSPIVACFDVAFGASDFRFGAVVRLDATPDPSVPCRVAAVNPLQGPFSGVHPVA